MLDFVISVVASGIQMTIPFLIVALGETVTERSGVRNLGLEGIILASGFGTFYITYETGNPWLGLAAGILIGGLIGVFLAFSIVKLGANQLIMGVMVTILCTGLSSFLYSRLFESVIITPIRGFRPVEIPTLSRIPIVGEVLFDQNILAYISLLLVPVLGILLLKTTIGLTIRACGESPQTAESVGIDVYRVRSLALILGSMMVGFGGAYLLLADAKWFSHGMSAGRGWIALAIVIFGRWNPYLVLLGSLLYGIIYALQIGLQTKGIGGIPYQFFLMLPYITILLTLAISRRETGKPATLGAPFRKSV